ncbi:hypothetical protein BCR33DRAFT_219853 [Rhizoclosmatium globosum]|uniref:Uncharacterized protein n=1 Tax=Rhizoclosmatium globosum TaxID=329046 RepID=A0A1Y2CBV1_9FUNG|nr:hypothetical protein BCR33DRAFT_219853 [Rhizoclosmatium globosum]|eukprot:ORY44367.1 hypothetical protein BCR33DRAFT_219853 [Rhizoclosmatium globosum]
MPSNNKKSRTCPTTIQHQRWFFAAAPKLATLAFHLSVQPTVNSALVFWITHYLNEGVPVALLPKTLLQHLITQRKETTARATVFANLWLEIAAFIPQSIRKQSILNCNDLVPGGYDRGGVGWSCSCKQFVDRVEAKLWEYAGTHDVGHILASYAAFLGVLTYEPETDALFIRQ